jgi:hypothetical protein
MSQGDNGHGLLRGASQGDDGHGLLPAGMSQGDNGHGLRAARSPGRPSATGCVISRAMAGYGHDHEEFGGYSR